MEAAVENQRNPSTEWLVHFRKNERLAQVARNYSQTMKTRENFSHTGPDGDTSAQSAFQALLPGGGREPV